jgi:hypothetical protein
MDDGHRCGHRCGHFNAPASGLKAAGLRSRTAHGETGTSKDCQDDLASVEGLTAALRRARDQSETASRASCLLGAHRDLREPLTAMLRLHSDWNVRGTDMVAVRMIEQQRQALNVMADLIDGFLTIAEPEIARCSPHAHEPCVAICWRNCVRGAQSPAPRAENGQPNGPWLSADRPVRIQRRSGQRPAYAASS